MNHLGYSFFVCNKPIDAGIKEFTTMRVGAFYVGCSEGFLPVEDGADGIFFSLEAMELYRIGLSMHNTMLINGASLTLNGSLMNNRCIYYINDTAGENVAIFNDLFIARNLLKALGLPVLYSNEPVNEELTFFQQVQRMKCGEQLQVRAVGGLSNLDICTFSDFPKEPNSYFKNIRECKTEFYKILESDVGSITENIWDISVALSGGVDSGTIAYLLKKWYKNVKAYTVSTDWGDEYAAAKETADFLGIELELVHLTKEEIINEVPNVIRFFHFTSPENIEIALVAHCLYKKLYEADGVRRTFLTGYGSDLLNAGVYTPFKHYDELEADCFRRIRATQLSNEFSNLDALNYGVKVHHPFWGNEVISCALKVPAQYKVKRPLIGKEQDKFYFREMMEGKLPDNTVWRKNLGAHHGTGLSQHLRDVFGDGQPDSYQHAINKIHEEIFSYGNYEHNARQGSLASKPAVTVG